MSFSIKIKNFQFELLTVSSSFEFDRFKRLSCLEFFGCENTLKTWKWLFSYIIETLIIFRIILFENMILENIKDPFLCRKMYKVEQL